MNINKKTLLFIDIETRSNVDLTKASVYSYTQGQRSLKGVRPSEFSILLIAYAFYYKNEIKPQPVQIITNDTDSNLLGQLPEELYAALHDATIDIVAHNAQFERVCLNSELKMEIDPQRFICTASLAVANGLPRKLDSLCNVLFQNQAENQKDIEGEKLIKLFSKPLKKGKTNTQKALFEAEKNCNFNNQKTHPEEFEKFKQYCKQDVEVLIKVHEALKNKSLSGFEREVYALDQKINDTGVNVDINLAQKAIADIELYNKIALNRMIELTGLKNPNSLTQLKAWLNSEPQQVFLSKKVSKLDKEAVNEIIENLPKDFPPPQKLKYIYEVLDLRQTIGKSSIKKFPKMFTEANGRERVCGNFCYYGANTGRWAGRGVQLQNLPRPTYDNIENLRNDMLTSEFTEANILETNIPEMYSQLLRSSIIAGENKKLVVVDFAAIEARVLAWLAGESWKLDVFRGDGKIYEATAARMFGVPIEKVDKNQRYKGKCSELAMGYGGGVGAYRMITNDQTTPDSKIADLKNVWRAANLNITKLWGDLEENFRKCLNFKNQAVSLPDGRIKMIYRSDINQLRVQLPSGRVMSYYRAGFEGKSERYSSQRGIFYFSDNGKGFNKTETYGGKLTENFVQAIARDLLAESLLAIQKQLSIGSEIIMHIHDEIVIEAPENEAQKVYDNLISIMSTPPDWAEGLPLNADGYISDFYRK